MVVMSDHLRVMNLPGAYGINVSLVITCPIRKWFDVHVNCDRPETQGAWAPPECAAVRRNMRRRPGMGSQTRGVGPLSAARVRRPKTVPGCSRRAHRRPPPFPSCSPMRSAERDTPHPRPVEWGRMPMDPAPPDALSEARLTHVDPPPGHSAPHAVTPRHCRPARREKEQSQSRDMNFRRCASSWLRAPSFSLSCRTLDVGHCDISRPKRQHVTALASFIERQAQGPLNSGSMDGNQPVRLLAARERGI